MLTLGALAAPAAQAGSSGWEAILGGHIGSGKQAEAVARLARSHGFKVYVQKISSSNWEAEIFNGGSSQSAAQAVCARARKFSLPHCSVEQEFHGNGWSRNGS